MRAPEVNAPGAVGIADRAQGEQQDSEIFGESEAFRKRIATLAAELALRGYALHPLAGGGFLVSRWDRTAHAPDLRGVAAFLERLGGHR